MKQIFFALVLAIAPAAWAIDFDNPAAIGEWINGENGQERYLGFGSPFEYGTALSLARYLERTPKWGVSVVANYDYNCGCSWPLQFEYVQESQKPIRFRKLLTGGFNFIEAKNSDKVHLITDPGTIGYDWKNPKSAAAAEDLNDDLEVQIKTDAGLFRGSVLEFKESGRIGFLKGVDGYNYDWDQIILQETLKNEVRQNMEGFIKNYDYETYKKFGLPTSRGVLLYGPPGTGKSMIAKVVMSQIIQDKYPKPVSFIFVTARHISWTGSIQQIYSAARLLAPCVVFIEDIDLIAGTDRANKQEIKNELLQALNGIEPLHGVLTIGTTNLKDKLDPALLRSQRLGYHFEIGLPLRTERGELFQLFSRNYLTDGLDYGAYADGAESLSGADIQDITQTAVEAAVSSGSVIDGKIRLTHEHFQKAFALRRSTRFKD